MKELKKARMGMIAVAVVMLKSITKRLTGTRRLLSGMVTLMLVGMMLLVVAGGTSAEFACVADDGSGDAYFFGDIIMKSCTFNGSMSGTNSHGLRIGADDVVLDGAGYRITGDNTPYTIGIYNYDSGFGICGGGHNNVAIQNLEISGFTEGIRVEGTMNDQCTVCRQSVENNNIYNCVVHDNSEGFGINFWKCVCNSTIDHCTAYNTAGTLASSCDDPGAGIRLWGRSNHNTVTNNIAYDNDLAGIYSKKGCKYNYIANNVVSNNGKVDSGAEYTGGIRFQCKTTHWNTFENNIITDSVGPGIFIGGNNCTAIHNTITGSIQANRNNLGEGIWVDRDPGGGQGTELYENTFCDNEHLDINVQHEGGGTTTGNLNTCDTTSNYHDDGTTGCTYSCTPPEKPDLTITAKSETLTGSTLEVTYTVANNRGEGASASTTGIYAGSTQIVTDSVGALAAGASHTSTVTIDPFDCPCGTTVTIKVCADKDGAVDESDETNNCLENAFNCPSCAADPKLCTSPDPPSHNFGSVQQGQTRTWTFDITNCGGETLGWTVGADQTWITVSPESGSAADDVDTVAVTIDTTGLTAGATHEGTVTVGSNDGTKTGVISVSIPSSLEDPLLCTNPDPPSYDFGNVQEGETRTWTFDVTNCGTGTLTWTVSDDQTWITVNPAGGTDAGTVTVTIDTASLTPGTHTGTVTVESNGGTKTGTITVKVKGSQPPPPPAEVPTFTPIGMFALVGLLGIAGIGVIKRR